MTPPSVDSPASQTSEAFRKLCKLPPFQTVAIQVLSVNADDDDALKRLESLFGSDPALAAELLATANSAEFGFRSRISTIRHALSVLGVERTRSLAVTIAMAGYIRTRLPRDAVRPLWEHAIASAVLAQHLAGRNGTSSTLLYTAGLTHDLGRLGLYASSRDAYQPLVNMEFRSVEEAEDMERRLLGVTHSEAGGFLTRSWGFPAILSDCARYHHAPPENGNEDIRIVHQACQLADSMGYPELRLQTPAGANGDGDNEWTNSPLREMVERRMKQLC